MEVIETIRKPGQLAYLARGRRRVTWMVVRHLGDGDLCLHWISASCGETANPEIALRLALGTRRPGKRARPGSVEVTVAQIRNGLLNPDDFPRGVGAVLRGGFSSHALFELCSGCNQPEPDWSNEPEPLWLKADEDYLGHWHSPAPIDASDGSGHYVIFPARSSKRT